MFRETTVSWDRKSKTTGNTDDLGHPVLTSVIGFPRSVMGSLQAIKKRADPSAAGLRTNQMSQFLTEYADGAEGDIITKQNGEVLIVRDRQAETVLGGSRISHVTYTIEKAGD